MAEQVKAKLGFDLSAFRKGTTDAAKLVEQNLNDKNFNKFNNAVNRVSFSLKKKLGGGIGFVSGGIGKLSKMFGGLQGAIAGAVAAMGVYKLAGWLKEAIDQSQTLSDAYTKLANAANAVGADVDLSKVKSFARDASQALGVSQADIVETATDLLGRGIDPRDIEKWTLISVSAAKKMGGSVQDAGKKIADALNGQMRGLKELGIQAPITGDKISDAANAAKLLETNFSNVGFALVDPSERFNSIWENIKTNIGDSVLPYFDSFLEKVISILAAWQSGAMDKDLEKVHFWVGQLIESLSYVLNLLTAMWNLDKALFSFVTAAITQAIDAIWQLLKNGIPWLVDQVVKLAIDTLLSTVGSTGVGKKLLAQMGITDELSKSFGDAAAKRSAEMVSVFKSDAKTTGQMGTELGAAGFDLGKAFAGTETGTVKSIKTRVNEIVAQGDAVRAQQLAGLQNVAATPAVSQTSTVLRQQEETKAAAKDKTANERANTKQAKRFAGDISSGNTVAVTIVSNRQDRFRKARR